jgi:molybdenum cofactor cytidylyltransferase
MEGVAAVVLAAGSASRMGRPKQALQFRGQSLLRRAALASLTEAHRVTRSPIVASSYGGGFGVPALFARTFFAELVRLEDGAGAKHLIERHAADAHFLPFGGGEVDLDTPDDVARLIALGAN